MNFLSKKFGGVKNLPYLCTAIEKDSNCIAQVVELVDTLL